MNRWLFGLLCAAGILAPFTTVCVAAPATAGRTGQSIILRNARCRIALDARTGEILSLQPGPASLRGRWFEVVEESREGLHTWETWQHGAETLFSGGPAAAAISEAGGAASATFTWQRPNGLRIEGEVALAAGDAGPRFRLKVANTTGAALVDTLRLPVLRGITLGDAEDDWITWPHTLGARFRVNGFGPGQRLETHYPDFLYMQWLDLHDASQGVYLGCLDSYGYSKLLFIGREPDGRSAMGVTFVGCWVARKGDSWTTPWVQVAAHRGDWRAGADLYRAFAEKAFGPLDPPERVREMPTAQCWLAHHASDRDVAKLFEVQQQAPIHASYVMKSLNTSIPEGWDGFRGSALEYQDAFRRIRELGGSPALFTFDRAPLMGRPDYAAHVSRWICRRRDGSFVQGWRDIMPSPFDADLVRARAGEAARWVQAFRLDEMHFDTAATTGPLAGPSYDGRHPQRPNEVPHYFKGLYRAIRDACRKHNPEFLLRAEHCADFFTPEFLTSTAHLFETGNLVAQHNPPTDAQLLPILFRYTLPRHAALQMPSLSDSDFWTYGLGMGHGFHGGGPSWCFNPGVREAESPPGELLHRYRFYDGDWRRYYDFRVGFEEAVVDSERSDEAARAWIDGRWQPCAFPGPLIAVTHSGGGREVTLGQWYHESRTAQFGARFVGEKRLAPRPVRLRVPTRLAHPRVRLFGERGEVKARITVSGGMIEAEIPDPRCFALEAFTGPALSLKVAELAHPGAVTPITIALKQDEPRAGTLSLQLPAGWPRVAPVQVPARPEFSRAFPVRVPAGIFGRNYPIKAVFRTGSFARTAAAHLKVMEPVTVLYSFDALEGDGPAETHALDPGRPARLRLTCINNTPSPGEIEVRIEGEQITGRAAQRVEGIAPRLLGDRSSPLGRWAEGQGPMPGNALVKSFDFRCSGVPKAPTRIRVSMGGRPVFATEAFPRTRLMDLNGEWRAHFSPVTVATVGGAERQDALDVEKMTPDVWDGRWEALRTPIRLGDDERRARGWGIYRRLVYVPAEWQGVEIRLRLSHTGAPWGAGGTLNLVYANGWPCGRIGTSGECALSSFFVFGGWNLLAVASYLPNSLVDPYLFVRKAPAPERLRPAPAAARPEGAFLLLGPRPTGQGIRMPFIEGVPEGDHRRTNVAAGGENVFLYFAVADDFLREPKGPVEVEVEYLDRGRSPFSLDYDSTDASAPVKGAFKSAPPCSRTDTGEWRRQVFVLPDARLANRQHQGADLRVWASGEDLHVRRIDVRRGR